MLFNQGKIFHENHLAIEIFFVGWVFYSKLQFPMTKLRLLGISLGIEINQQCQKSCAQNKLECFHKILILKMTATPNKNELEMNLMDSLDKPDQITPQSNPGQPVVWEEFQYKEFGDAPKLNYSGLFMAVVGPVLISVHVLAARLAHIPIIQFGFVTVLIAFIVNYTAIIRKHELMPYLPQKVYDDRLKRLCVLSLVGVLMSMKWGWNGSSGMIFACYWEYNRGNRMGIFWYIYLLIGGGSLIMEQYNVGWQKLLEFVPGLIFGYVASTLFTMRDSSTYAITHQFVFLCSMIIPMFFPASKLIVPSIWQWILMLVAGLSVLFTVLLIIKLMQSERASISVASISGIVMLGTTTYISLHDFIGAAMILAGTIWMIKKEYIEVQL